MSPKINVTPKELTAIKAMRSGIVKTKAGHPAREREDKKMTHEVEPDFAYEVLSGIGTFGPRVDPAGIEVYNPPESKRIPKDGAWVMITRKLPPMEKGMQKVIRVGRIFWASHQEGTDEFGFSPDGTYKIILTTHWGTVHVWPYEYSMIDAKAIFEMWDQKELIFHPAGNRNVRWSDAIFYLRSRGIGLVDAVVMALGTVKGPVGWFEPAPDIAREMEAMEERVHRWKPSRTLKAPMEIHLDIKKPAEDVP